MTTLNSDHQDDGMWAMPDDLTLYFSAARDGLEYRIFRAWRNDPNSDYWNFDELGGNINAWDSVQSPALTPDGLTIYFYMDSDIYMAKRGSQDDGFGTFIRVDNVDSAAGDADPFYAATTNRLYFASDRESHDWNLYVATLTGEPAALDNVNTAHREETPVLSKDELTLYYARDQTAEQNNKEVWVAERANLDAPFQVIGPVTELNSAHSEYPETLSPDGCTIYFVSDRDGNNDFFYATRQ